METLHIIYLLLLHRSVSVVWLETRSEKKKKKEKQTDNFAILLLAPPSFTRKKMGGHTFTADRHTEDYTSSAGERKHQVWGGKKRERKRGRDKMDLSTGSRGRRWTCCWGPEELSSCGVWCVLLNASRGNDRKEKEIWKRLKNNFWKKILCKGRNYLDEQHDDDHWVRQLMRSFERENVWKR